MTDNKNIPKKRKRPGLVTLLVIVILILTLVHWTRFIQAWRNRAFLAALPLTVSPFYLTLEGFFWGLVGLPLIWGLWTGKPWARTAALLSGGLFALQQWGELFWLAAPEVLATRWLIALILTVLGEGLLFLSLFSPNARRFFDQRPKV
jgi:hypothetical protein